MPETHDVSFTSGTPETILPGLEPERARALSEAASEPKERRRALVSAIAAGDPRCLQAWATLAELSDDVIERYAYARVGYHRGLDALRAAGWRGTGHVRWTHPENRGFLASLEALRAAAGAIGEEDEQQRCALFLRQLDPDWASGGMAQDGQ